jgi:hypothetical protein
MRIAAKVGVVLHCVATNKGGQPRHPLYAPYDAPLVAWRCGQIEIH